MSRPAPRHVELDGRHRIDAGIEETWRELNNPDALEILHDWSDTSPVRVDPCDMHLRGKGHVQATIKAQQQNVNGETFACRIELQSEAGIGTTISVFFPRPGSAPSAGVLAREGDNG